VASTGTVAEVDRPTTTRLPVVGVVIKLEVPLGLGPVPSAAVGVGTGTAGLANEDLRCCCSVAGVSAGGTASVLVAVDGIVGRAGTAVKRRGPTGAPSAGAVVLEEDDGGATTRWALGGALSPGNACWRLRRARRRGPVSPSGPTSDGTAKMPSRRSGSSGRPGNSASIASLARVAVFTISPWRGEAPTPSAPYATAPPPPHPGTHTRRSPSGRSGRR
jgi:hypothetical protein